jgi:hypothetical protein
MRESALFGTMFGLGAGAVLVGVTVSRLVGGPAPEKPAEQPSAAVVEAAPPAAVTPPPAAIPSAPPPVVSSVAPPAEIALSGQHRALPRKHRRPPAEAAAPSAPAPIVEATPRTPAPVVEQTPPATASIANREAPSPAPQPARVDDPPVARDGPIAIVRGGVARPASGGPGARVIQVEPQGQ